MFHEDGAAILTRIVISGVRFYYVESGDSCYSIATDAGVSLEYVLLDALLFDPFQRVRALANHGMWF